MDYSLFFFREIYSFYYGKNDGVTGTHLQNCKSCRFESYSILFGVYMDS